MEFPLLAARDPGAAYEIAQRSVAILPEQAMSLAYRVGPERILENVILPRSTWDPLSPDWLAVLATIQFQQGRPSFAWQSIAQAMELGAHQPSVRLARVKAMEANQDMRWQATAELLDALHATDGSMDLVAQYQHRMISPPETLSHNQDGTPNAAFDCLRLLYLERFVAWCTENTTDAGRAPSHKCGGGAADRMEEVMAAARSTGQCGTAPDWRTRMVWLVENAGN